ncbi:GH25 family lysozyme, partial [Streptococcus sp. DD10]|uniref:GH25 family lysozyme n=1 Tax=Streptococcus sp. DD10 TaxID=1777878 RepID=UPI001E4A222B
MRKKMYKKGKFWVIASIAATSVITARGVEAQETNSSSSLDTTNTISESISEASQSPTPTTAPVLATTEELTSTTTDKEETLAATSTTPSTGDGNTEKQTEQAEKTETEKINNNGYSAFRTASNNGTPAPTKQETTPTFVDVSSHNGTISTEDYRSLARQGVAGVVVKLTEGTSYKNPYAPSQIKNAQEAGLQVSAYAYSHYTNEEEARQEARYFAKTAKELNLPSYTVMVNDIEEAKMKERINEATKAWAQEMKNLGFNDLMYYAAASWLDNSRWRGPIKTAELGAENVWAAQYPTNNLSADDARSLRYNNNSGAWQFTSNAELLKGKHVFDLSLDYTGRFTKQARVEVGAKPSAKIAIQNLNNNAGT